MAQMSPPVAQRRLLTIGEVAGLKRPVPWDVRPPRRPLGPFLLRRCAIYVGFLHHFFDDLVLNRRLFTLSLQLPRLGYFDPGRLPGRPVARYERPQ